MTEVYRLCVIRCISWSPRAWSRGEPSWKLPADKKAGKPRASLLLCLRGLGICLRQLFLYSTLQPSSTMFWGFLSTPRQHGGISAISWAKASTVRVVLAKASAGEEVQGVEAVVDVRRARGAEAVKLTSGMPLVGKGMELE